MKTVNIYHAVCLHRRKNREQRENVVQELIKTEREYCRDLSLTSQVAGLDSSSSF
jgi:hypothetical protein